MRTRYQRGYEWGMWLTGDGDYRVEDFYQLAVRNEKAKQA